MNSSEFFSKSATMLSVLEAKTDPLHHADLIAAFSIMTRWIEELCRLTMVSHNMPEDQYRSLMDASLSAVIDILQQEMLTPDKTRHLGLYLTRKSDLLDENGQPNVIPMFPKKSNGN